jgi:hypothetical protein
MLLAFGSIAKANCFEFNPDSVHDGDHWSCLESKCRQHRTELVDRQRIVALQQRIPTQSPIRMTKDSILKLSGAFHQVKISRIRFWAFSYSNGALALIPAKHVLHGFPPLSRPIGTSVPAQN